MSNIRTVGAAIRALERTAAQAQVAGARIDDLATSEPSNASRIQHLGSGELRAATERATYALTSTRLIGSDRSLVAGLETAIEGARLTTRDATSDIAALAEHARRLERAAQSTGTRLRTELIDAHLHATGTRSASDRDRLLAAMRAELPATLDPLTDRQVERMTRLLRIGDSLEIDLGLHGRVGGDPYSTILLNLADDAPDQSGMHRRLAETVRAELEGLREDPERARQALLEIARSRPSTTDPRDWARIDGVLHVSKSASVEVGLARTVSGQPVSTTSMQLASGWREHAPDGERLLRIWATQHDLAEHGADGAVASLRSLVEGDLPLGERVARLDVLTTVASKELAEAGLTVSWAAGSPSHDLAKLLRPVQAGSLLPVVRGRSWIEMWRMQLNGSAADANWVHRQLTSFAGRDPANLGEDDLSTLLALTRIAEDRAAPISTELRMSLGPDRASTLILRQASLGGRDSPELRRLFAMWQYEADGTTASADRVRAEVARILNESDDAPSREGWTRIAALLDLTPLMSTGDLRLSRGLTGNLNALEVASREALGTTATNRGAARLLAHWRAELDGTAADSSAVRAELLALAQRPIDQIDTSDWQRVEALLDSSRGRAEAIGLRDLEDARLVAHHRATGGRPNRPLEQRVLATWRAQLEGLDHDPERVRAELVDWARRDPMSLTQAELTRIAALLAVSRDRPRTVGLARGVVSLVPSRRTSEALDAENVVRIEQRGPGTTTRSALRALLALWSDQAEGTIPTLDGINAELRSFARRDPSTVSPDEWRRIGRLLQASMHMDNDATIAQRAAGRPAWAIADMLADGTSDDHGRIGERLLATWRLQDSGLAADPSRARAAMLRLVEHPANELTSNDWLELETLLDATAHDPKILGVMRRFGSLDLSALFEQRVSGHSGIPGTPLGPGRTTLDAARLDAVSAGQEARVLRAWLAQLGTDALTPDAARSELHAILRAGPPTPEGWQRIQTIIDLTEEVADQVGVRRDRHAFDFDVRDRLASHAAGTTTRTSELRDAWLGELEVRALDSELEARAVLRTALRRIGMHPDATDQRWLQLIRDIADERGWNLGISRTLEDVSIGRWSDDRARQRTLAQWRIELGDGFAASEQLAFRDGALGAHLVRRSDVDSFLSQSAWPHTVFHGNSNAETHASVIEHGPLIERNKRSAWGQGFYTALEPGGWGDDIVETAIDTRSPFVAESGADAFGRSVRELWRRQHPGEAAPNELDAATVHATLRAAGHDAIMIHRPRRMGGDWIVGLDPTRMRIVVEDAAGVPDVRPPSPSRLVAD